MPKRKSAADNAAEMQHAPAVMSERERRAALVPEFKDGKISITPEQLAHMKDELHADHGLCLQSAVNAATAANAYKGDVGDSQKNAALRLLLDLRPQNAMERMLVSQLIATDQAASLCMGIGVQDTNGPEARRKYLSLAMQFQGLQVRQIEALAKLRNGNQQTVKVEHVHVHQGGQAIVGNVSHAPGVGGGAGGRD